MPHSSVPKATALSVPGLIMDVSIPSILLGLGGKAVMGLALLLFHRSYLNHSFLGVFSLSLTLVDTLLSLFLSALYFQEDMSLLGLRFTRHHICLLAQIAGFTYNHLLWPVVVVTGLDHYWTTNIQGPGPTLRSPCSEVKCPPGGGFGSPSPSSPTSPTSLGNAKLTQDQCLHPGATLPNVRRRPPVWVVKIFYLTAVCLLWIVALVYVILGSGLTPVLGNQSPYQLNHCWVFTSAHTRQVAGTLLLTLACALVYVHGQTESLMRGYQGRRMLARMKALLWSYTDRQDRVEVVHQLLWIFLNTWALFLVFLIVCLVCQVGIPGYLGLNVPWLCLLNSFLLGVVLCVRCPAPKLAQGSVTTDGFCNWRLSPVESQSAGGPILLN